MSLGSSCQTVRLCHLAAAGHIYNERKPYAYGTQHMYTCASLHQCWSCTPHTPCKFHCCNLPSARCIACSTPQASYAKRPRVCASNMGSTQIFKVSRFLAAHPQPHLTVTLHHLMAFAPAHAAVHHLGTYVSLLHGGTHVPRVLDVTAEGQRTTALQVWDRCRQASLAS